MTKKEAVDAILTDENIGFATERIEQIVAGQRSKDELKGDIQSLILNVMTITLAYTHVLMEGESGE